MLAKQVHITVVFINLATNTTTTTTTKCNKQVLCWNEMGNVRKLVVDDLWNYMESEEHLNISYGISHTRKYFDTLDARRMWPIYTIQKWSSTIAIHSFHHLTWNNVFIVAPLTQKEKQSYLMVVSNIWTRTCIAVSL